MQKISYGGHHTMPPFFMVGCAVLMWAFGRRFTQFAHNARNAVERNLGFWRGGFFDLPVFESSDSTGGVRLFFEKFFNLVHHQIPVVKAMSL